MKLERSNKITPKGPPGRPTASDDYVWRELVPLLLHPGKLNIIQTLLGEGRPLSPTELGESVNITIEHARDHCESMDRHGVLEIVHRVPRPDGDGDEPFYFFSKPSQSSPSPHG